MLENIIFHTTYSPDDESNVLSYYIYKVHKI
jgi:hypothetical protein